MVSIVSIDADSARAASIGDHTVPVVTSQDDAFTDRLKGKTTLDDSAMPQKGGQSTANLHHSLQRLPDLQKALKAQDSVGVPDTPDTETLERHAALHREHSSFSKGTAADLMQHDQSTATLQRKGVLTTSGLLDLAMSDVPPTEELEPDMIAAFLADGDVFSDKPDQ